MITTECHTAVGPKKIPSHLRKVADQSAAQHLMVTAKCIDGQKEQKASAWKCLGFSDANPQLTAQALTDLRSIRHLFTRTGADSPVCHASFNTIISFTTICSQVTDPTTAFKQWCSSLFACETPHSHNSDSQGIGKLRKRWLLWRRLKKMSRELLQIVAENCKLIEAFLYTFMKAN